MAAKTKKATKKKAPAKRKAGGRNKSAEAAPLEAQKLPPFPKYFDLVIGAGRYQVDSKGMTGAHALAMAHMYRQLNMTGSSDRRTCVSDGSHV